MIEISNLSINGIDYTDYVTMPPQTQETLDESYDMIYCELRGVNLANPFTPFDDVNLTIKEDKIIRNYKMIIESDNVSEMILNGLYNHDVLLIEETKWSERFFIEKSIRQPLFHDYFDATEYAYIFDQNNSIQNKTTSIINIKTPIAAGIEYTAVTPYNFAVAMLGEFFANSQSFKSNLKVYKNNIKIYDDVGYGSKLFTFTWEEYSEYRFEYAIFNNSTDYYYYEVTAIPKPIPKDDYTIRDVINQLCETAITLRQGETPIFSIASITEYSDGEYAKKVKEILDSKSPEFTFSKMSLWEALKMIGENCHFIPKIKNRKIYLDLLGLDIKTTLTNTLSDYYSNTLSLSSNDFCNKLDSQANNLTNLDDINQGSVTTPFNNGYRTLRTETGIVKITDNNIIIPTEDNIEKIIKLEIGYLSDNTLVGDITPYVYEESEYKGLSSYGSTFPYSKMFAIKYKQGQPNITGLDYERPNTISQAFEGIAIKNIIYRKIHKGTNWWTNLLDKEDVFQLQYRLTYIPSTNARVTQSKANKEDIGKPISIAYNQGASKIASNALGENFKGTIAKIGNIEKKKMYIIPHINKIPKCGQKFDDDYYISVVKCEFYPTFVKCEVGLSKNYNNKNAYVEINSQLEFFEYDRNIIIDRYIIYEEYCEVGTDSYENETIKSIITSTGITKFADAFENINTDSSISLVLIEGYDNDNNKIGNYYDEFALPIISLGIGNSILLAFHFEDSISAGNTARYIQGEREQQSQKYVDIYGEVKSLKLAYGSSVSQIIAPNEYTKAVQMGDSIPRTDYIGNIDTYFNIPSESKMIIDKGVGEIPHISFQLHFISNKNNLIIGSGLSRKSNFVTNEIKNYKLFILDHPINKFDTKINLTNAIDNGTITLTKDFAKKQIKLGDFTALANGKAWAICQVYYNDDNNIIDNDLIIGENKEILLNDVVEMPYFTFKRNIYK